MLTWYEVIDNTPQLHAFHFINHFSKSIPDIFCELLYEHVLIFLTLLFIIFLLFMKVFFTDSILIYCSRHTFNSSCPTKPLTNHLKWSPYIFRYSNYLLIRTLAFETTYQYFFPGIFYLPNSTAHWLKSSTIPCSIC